MPLTAQQSAESGTSKAPGNAFRGSQGRGGRGPWGLRRLVRSVVRIADLQYRIWLTRAKIAAVRLAMFAAIFSAALLLGILAVIFLFIGAFRVLTDVAGIAPVWAYLIMGGGTLLLAVLCAWIGIHSMGRHDEPETSAIAGETEPATQGAGT